MSKYQPGLDDDRLVGAALAALAEDTAREEAPPAVEDRLRAAFRAPAAAPASRPESGAWKWLAGLGAAAGLAWLAYAGLAPEKSAPREAERREPPSSVEAPRAAARVTPEPAAGAVEVSQSAPRTRRAADAPPRRARRQPVIERFEALYPGDPLADLDAVHTVRLSVPRSALATLGWPSRAGLRDEPVEMEAMVGPDGMARAVRFISR